MANIQENKNEHRDIPASFPFKNTQEESIWESVKRDLTQIGERIKYVIVPFGHEAAMKSNHLKNWDLWGPLLLCIMLSLTLTINSEGNADSSSIFGTVFTQVWLGAVVVTINATLQEGNVSFFHSVSTLGYSLFPMNVVAILNITVIQYLSFWIGLCTTIFATLWSIKSSSMYMSPLISPEKRGLALYPVCLFYVFLSFFIVHVTIDI